MSIARGLGALAGVLACFVGLMSCVARDRNSSNGLNQANAHSMRVRNVYSPNIASDPYVIDEQRRVARALRQSCDGFGEHCEEAEAAEDFVARAEARR